MTSSRPVSVRILSALPLLLLASCGGDTGDDTSTALGLGFAADDKSRGGTVEMCDGIDNNANGRTDEACGQCDYLATRAKTFWTRQQCAMDGGATGESLLPITLGTQTFGTFAQVRTMLTRNSSTNNTLALGQEIVTAKLNAAAMNIGDVTYIDVTRDGVADTVDTLIATAETVYSSGPASAKMTWVTTMSTFNAIGAAVPLYFDSTCVLESEICDGVDNDGDARVDENCGCIEVCDGLDNDANGLVDDDAVDGDGDGYACDDCDDADAAVYPGAAEAANGIDDNCDGNVDEGLDGDGDGVTTADGDCDDADAGVFPGNTETCNGIDDNCSGGVDEGVMLTFYADPDGDGYGDASSSVTACAAPAGYVANSADCNSAIGSVNPGATEVCNGIDDNCSGAADEGVTSVYYGDADSDGYGSSSSGTSNACSAPSGYVNNSTDCNDASASVRPGMPETCNGIDDNCSGVADEGVTLTFYRDSDSDGYGNVAVTSTGCTVPPGYVPNSSDCNDTTNTVRPGAPEVCNGSDDNCNGSVDEGAVFTFYRDADGDGHGSPSVTTTGCSAPSGYVPAPDDCNDANSAVYTGATETCNGLDDNCNGSFDEGVTTTYYRDADSDSYGAIASGTVDACSAPSGYVGNIDDCNDGMFSIHPGAAEVCNSVDDNCNGSSDEGVTTTFYTDADGDTYGNLASPVSACSQPAGTSINSTDCNDASSAIRPGATEIRGDGIDQDCSGADLPYTYSYATNVQPIFNSFCTSCHNAGGAYGLNLLTGTSYSKLVNVASGQLAAMDRVEPGSYTTSYMYLKLLGTQASVGGSGSRMPLGGAAMSAANLTIIRTWITEGAPNN